MLRLQTGNVVSVCNANARLALTVDIDVALQLRGAPDTLAAKEALHKGTCNTWIP